MKKRLSKALAAAGVASRRHCEEIIFEGRVSVNGNVVIVPQTLVDWRKDKIHLDGSRILREEKKFYYILNKPKGYVCSNLRKSREKLVIDLFGGEQERLFTVGRLDRDTTGLIIVTNDGHFANRVIHPSNGIDKEYVAKVGAEVNHKDLVTLSEGIRIDRKKVCPVSVKKVRRGTVKITVSEGKKHEVRLMLEAAKLPCKELSRVRIGGLQLGNLTVGGWKELTEDQIEQIFC
jgi:23S rRNA pseudouridine2605 synthase